MNGGQAHLGSDSLFRGTCCLNLQGTRSLGSPGYSLAGTLGMKDRSSSRANAGCLCQLCQTGVVPDSRQALLTWTPLDRCQSPGHSGTEAPIVLRGSSDWRRVRTGPQSRHWGEEPANAFPSFALGWSVLAGFSCETKPG